jgi:uncharacterized membrane protein YeaQ/YmgE (transglycosylase-associated protein family)
MAWTWANLIIEIIAGFLGANIAAAAAPEYRFGFLRHSMVGLLIGALSGVFLQTYAATVVTGSGTVNEPTHAEIVVIQLTGAVVGAIAMLAVGLILSERSTK